MASNTKALQKHESHQGGGAERTHARKVFTPRVDILESAHDILVTADMPGVNEKSVHVTLENGVLTIDGTVNWEEPKDYDLVYSEFDVGDYHRAFSLPEAIDQRNIAASVSNGVLHLRLPKAEEAKPRQIVVKAG